MSGPAVVLVHGSAHGPWSWSRVLPHLEVPAVVPELPGRGDRPMDAQGAKIQHSVDAIVQDIRSASLEEVVLVGHSLAGIVLPGVALELGSAVRHMVFVAAVVCSPREDAVAASFATPMRQFVRFTDRITPRRKPAQEVPERWARRLFCNDMDEDQTSFVLENLCPEPVAPSREAATVTVEDLPAIPKTYVKCTRDRMLKPRRQDLLAARLGRGAQVVELDAGHDAMISQPSELATVLNAVVTSLNGTGRTPHR